VETRLFELTGRWASGDGPAQWRLFCSVASGFHGALATEWRHRLPVRAGIDQEALIQPPPGSMVATIEGLEELALPEALPVLVERILPDLVVEYHSILESAAPEREAPVMALLARATILHADVTERGQVLLQ
jgi:hypothetical protein